MNEAQRDKALVAVGYMTGMGQLSAADAALLADHVKAGTLTADQEAELLGLVDHTETLAAASTLLVACTHPAHRRGTRGGLGRNQEVCMQCGDVVLKRSA